MQICQSADQMAEQVVELIQNQAQRDEMGGAAQRIAEANRGALDRLLSLIDKTI